MSKAMRLLTLVGLVAAVAAGCGSADDQGGGETAAEGGGVQTLTVGVIPAVDVAPLYLGIEKGFFREEGLDVKPELVQGGPASIAAVMSGDDQIAFAGTVPLILARAQGLPVKIVAAGNRAAEDPAEAWEGLIVKDDDSINSLKDLEGTTIATNAVKGMTELTVRELLEREGVDVSTIKFTEVAIPDMPAALSGGRVPVVGMSEPFMSVALQDGAKSVTPMFAGLEPGMMVGTYFTSEETLSKDPELVAKFRRAMNASLDYAQAHPEEARAIVATYAEIPPPLLKALKLPLWGSDLNQPSIQLMADLAEKHGFAEEKVDVGELIDSGSEGT